MRRVEHRKLEGWKRVLFGILLGGPVAWACDSSWEAFDAEAPDDFDAGDSSIGYDSNLDPDVATKDAEIDEGATDANEDASDAGDGDAEDVDAGPPSPVVQIGVGYSASCARRESGVI